MKKRVKTLILTVFDYTRKFPAELTSLSAIGLRGISLCVNDENTRR